MKKFLVAIVSTYILLLTGYHFYQTYELAAMGTLLLIPTTLILSIINFRKLRINRGSHDLVLISCLALGISLITAIGRIGLFDDYYNPGFLIVTTLLTLIIGLLVNKISFNTGITVLIPLIVIFGIEVYQSNDFVTIQDIHQLDELSYEIQRSNIQLANSIREGGKEIKYSNTLSLMNNFLEDVIAYTGGYSQPTPMSRLIAPNSKVPEELEEWIFRIRNSLDKDIEKESTEQVKSTLGYIKNGLFNENSLDNTALEMRLRIYSAQNQLLILNLANN